MSDGTINIPNRATAPSTPTIGRSKIWVDNTDKKARITDDTGFTRPFESIFGNSFALNKKTIIESNSAATFQIYISQTYEPIAFASGTYRVELVFLWRMSNTTTSIEVGLNINGVLYESTILKESKDASDVCRECLVYYIPVGTLLASNTFELVFRPESGGNTATIYSGSLAAWRVE